jgi:hypothetical protein
MIKPVTAANEKNTLLPLLLSGNITMPASMKNGQIFEMSHDFPQKNIAAGEKNFADAWKYIWQE